MRDHIDPGGEVPVLTKTGLGTGIRLPFCAGVDLQWFCMAGGFVLFLGLSSLTARTSCCLSKTKSSGCAWKQLSVRGSSAGHSRYE